MPRLPSPQVRRMFGAVGNEVTALQRISIGELGLGELEEGQWRYATQQDLQLVLGSAAEAEGGERPAAGAAASSEPAAGSAAEEEPAASSSSGTGDELEEEEQELEQAPDIDPSNVEAMYEYFVQQQEQRAAAKKYRSSSKFRRRREMLKRSMPALAGAGRAAGGGGAAGGGSGGGSDDE
jgi:hypothetical protein